MKITVLAKANSRVDLCTQTGLPAQAGKVEVKKIGDETVYIVSVKEKPVMGKANQAIIKALAKHFKIPTYAICIIAGERSKRKIVEISI